MGHKVNGTSWKKVGGESVATLKAKLHAELSKLAELDGNNPVLLVQDAFPCHACHATLIEKSKTTNIIVKVEKNQGSYSLDHGLGANPGLPVTIYYSAGAAVYVPNVGPLPAVPVAFNGAPNFATLSYY